MTRIGTLATLMVTVVFAGCATAPSNGEEAEAQDEATTDTKSAEITSCVPPLKVLEVEDLTYYLAKNNPKIDRSLLVPTLRTDYEWKCYNECGGPAHVACIGLSHFDPRSGEENEDFSCGFPIYFARSTANGTKGEHSISYRSFNHDKKLTHRIIHNNATDTYSRNADGSGKKTQGSWNAFFDDVFVTPGDTSEATETITGLDFIQQAVPSGQLLVLDVGQLTSYPDGSFTPKFGRWDMWNNYDAANARMCAALQ